MLFNSFIFILRFLPVTLFLYYIVPYKFKNSVLLLCSLFFYCWGDVRFLPVILIGILLNFFCGAAMQKFDEKLALRRTFFLISILGSVGMLFYFKYSNFFIGNFNALFGTSIPLIVNLALPLGISFYTFQSLSYTIDVYRRDVPAERNIITFGTYIVMFPQLISGPIVRYSEISARLNMKKGRVTFGRIDEGIEDFIFGLAKKVLLGDTIGLLWKAIVGTYSDSGALLGSAVTLENASTPLVWLGILAFGLQIYFDFSGYSQMAIGLGKMLGFDFPQNFNLPYISKSITEFWRRWHITLSGWFREYVYIPLGGNRKGLPRQILNILIVWFLTGFWHGASWNFIFWGLYFAVFIIIEKIWLLPHLEKGKVWPHIYSLIIIFVGWALFVAGDPGVSLSVLFSKLFVPQGGVSILYYARNFMVPLLLGIFFSTPFPKKIYAKIKPHSIVRIILLAVLLVASFAYMAASTYSPFLYFKF